MKRAAIYMLCILLILGVISVPAHAKTSRSAIITEVVGVVEVTKSGGSKSYRAYVDMTLNQGDLIETGEGAKVVLRLADTEDEITVGQNSRIYISELTEEGSGKQSKLKVWAGALWSKVRTLAGAEDEFEVETPTATMGVRGTQFFVGVHQETGDPVFFTGSGFVAVRAIGSDGESLTLPGESTSFFGNESATAAVDLKEVFILADLHTLEAMVRGSDEMSEENRQLLLQDIAGSVQRSVSELEALAQYMGMVSEYVGFIVNLMNGTIDPEDVPETPEPEFDKELAEKERQRQEELRRIQQRKEEQSEATEARRKAIQEQNQELMNRIREQRSQQNEANETAKEQARQQALERYLSNLTEEERAEFEKRENQREEERKQSEQKAETYKAPLPVPSESASDETGSVGDGGSGSGGGGGDNGDGGSGGGDDPAPAVPSFELRAESVQLLEMGETAVFGFDLVAELKNVDGLYAAELHLLTDTGFWPADSPLEGPIFNLNDSESTFRIVDVDVDGNHGKEIIYAVTLAPPADAVDVTGAARLVTLPMRWNVYDWSNPDISHAIEIHMIKLVLVDAEGNPVEVADATTKVVIPLEEFKD